MHFSSVAPALRRWMPLTFILAIGCAVIALGQPAAPDSAATAALDSGPLTFVNIAAKLIAAKSWFAGIVAALVALIAGLRLYGKRLHAKIPDDHWADAPLWFLFNTKPGGWIFNWLVAVGGGCGIALIKDGTITPSVVKVIVILSTSLTTVYHFAADLIAWIKERRTAAPSTPPIRHE